MTDTLDLPISPDQLTRIRQAEAVVVCHYMGPHGRFARLDFIGTLEECEDVANTPGIVIMPTGVECEGMVVVPVGELRLPVEETSP